MPTKESINKIIETIKEETEPITIAQIQRKTGSNTNSIKQIIEVLDELGHLKIETIANRFTIIKWKNQEVKNAN